MAELAASVGTGVLSCVSDVPIGSLNEALNKALGDVLDYALRPRNRHPHRHLGLTAESRHLTVAVEARVDPDRVAHPKDRHRHHRQGMMEDSQTMVQLRGSPGLCLEHVQISAIQ